MFLFLFNFFPPSLCGLRQSFSHSGTLRRGIVPTKIKNFTTNYSFTNILFLFSSDISECDIL